GAAGIEGRRWFNCQQESNDEADADENEEHTPPAGHPSRASLEGRLGGAKLCHVRVVLRHELDLLCLVSCDGRVTAAAASWTACDSRFWDFLSTAVVCAPYVLWFILFVQLCLMPCTLLIVFQEVGHNLIVEVQGAGAGSALRQRSQGQRYSPG